MDVEDLFDLNQILWKERRCKSCGKTKDLLSDFYRTRKDRTSLSAYSYECKECTIKRVVASRFISRILDKWEYPDW